MSETTRTIRVRGADYDYMMRVLYAEYANTRRVVDGLTETKKVELFFGLVRERMSEGKGEEKVT